MILISPQQRETLRQILNFQENHGFFPTVRDLCKVMGIKSTNTIQVHLRGLEKKGYLERKDSRARAISITDKTYDEFKYSRKPKRKRPEVSGVPLLGQVPAGPLNEAVENSEGRMQLEDFVPVDESCYALVAKGDSMIKKGIQDGDILIVRHQTNADSGEIVVALLDGETTVKTLLHRAKGFVLQPGNDRYDPIKIPLDHDSFQICGKVTGVIHKV